MTGSICSVQQTFELFRFLGSQFNNACFWLYFNCECRHAIEMGPKCNYLVKVAIQVSKGTRAKLVWVCDGSSLIKIYATRKETQGNFCWLLLNVPWYICPGLWLYIISIDFHCVRTNIQLWLLFMDVTCFAATQHHVLWESPEHLLWYGPHCCRQFILICETYNHCEINGHCNMISVAVAMVNFTMHEKKTQKFVWCMEIWKMFHNSVIHISRDRNYDRHLTYINMHRFVTMPALPSSTSELRLQILAS